jgi:hypothetical protein
MLEPEVIGGVPAAVTDRDDMADLGPLPLDGIPASATRQAVTRHEVGARPPAQSIVAMQPAHVELGGLNRRFLRNRSACGQVAK